MNLYFPQATWAVPALIGVCVYEHSSVCLQIYMHICACGDQIIALAIIS